MLSLFYDSLHPCTSSMQFRCLGHLDTGYFSCVCFALLYWSFHWVSTLYCSFPFTFGILTLCRLYSHAFHALLADHCCCTVIFYVFIPFLFFFPLSRDLCVCLLQ
eukprot:m.6168 g.6168  ORF g.6168 m.6168 type:complete len:105 (+) comp5133_c2_seq1:3014-3328(+)